MLQKDNRLAKVRDFNLLMKYGRWINGQIFDLKVLSLSNVSGKFPKKEDPVMFAQQLKIAFTVGLKISKSAVKRNALKRKMREVVRLLVKDNKIKSGFYILAVARKEALLKEYSEISQEMILLLKRAGVICP